MFRWLAMLLREKLEAYYRRINERSQREPALSKAHHSRPTRKLTLESLEDRIVPSVTGTIPPPAVPSVAAIVSPPERPVVTAATTLYNDAIKTVETAISAHQHLVDTIRATLEAALQHHQHTVTPFDAPPAPPQMTIWTWKPTQSGNKASDPRNWLLNGNPQGANGSVPNGPNSEALFDGNVSNAGIVWDINFVFSEMVLGGVGAYTGQQTINSGVQVELQGAPQTQALATNVFSSQLNLFFGNGGTGASVFQIDANAKITNMNLAGNPISALFDIQGGTTTVAQSSDYVETIGVPVLVGLNATLTDNSFTSLNFSNSNLTITVDGLMTVFFGANKQNTLINSGNQSNDYIDVAGTLKYLGTGGVTDTFTVPVLVESLGNFIVKSAGNGTEGAKLVVSGKTGATNNVSVDMTGSQATVQLSQQATLECDNDYYQSAGFLETMDASNCTLQDGQDNAFGTATIAGGGFAINLPYTVGYGQLNVNATNLVFNGGLTLAINGQQGGKGPTNCSMLNVSGTTMLQNGAVLKIYINNAPAKNGNKWIFIQDGAGKNIQGDFQMPITTVPQTGLNPAVNPDDKTEYLVSF